MAAMEPARNAFLLATEPQFGDVDDRRGRMCCEVIQSEAGALGVDPRAIHVDIGKGWGFHRARSQSPPAEQSRQQTHEALLAFGCPIPLGESVRRRAESMPPVGLGPRTKSELLAGMPLFGAGADIALAGGKKLEGLPEYPRGDQLSARETSQRLCSISIDHQPRRRSPPPESLLPTRGWETLSPRQQNEHTLEAEKYALLLGRDTLRRERIEDTTPRLLKDNMSTNSTVSSVTARSPRAGWNKYFHLGKLALNGSEETPRLENDIARWYKSMRRDPRPALCTTSSSPRKSQQPELHMDAIEVWDASELGWDADGDDVDAFDVSKLSQEDNGAADLSTAAQSLEHSIVSSPLMCPCFVVTPPSDSIECSPMKDMEGDDITPVATTAGSSIAGSSPPSSTPPVPFSPAVPDSEYFVVGNITIPARLQTVHPSQSARKCSAPVVNAPVVNATVVNAPMVLSPRKQLAPGQKAKAVSSRLQPKAKQIGSYGQRSGAMSTPVPASFPASSAVSGNASRKSYADTRAALKRMKELKAQMMSPSCDLASVQMELDAVQRMLR